MRVETVDGHKVRGREQEQEQEQEQDDTTDFMSVEFQLRS